MSTSNVIELTLIPDAQLRDYLREMDSLFHRFPCGQLLFGKVIQDFIGFFTRAESRRSQVAIVRMAEDCRKAYDLFKELSKLSPIEWIREHRRIFSRARKLLSFWTPYDPQSREFVGWRMKMFKHIRGYTRKIQNSTFNADEQKQHFQTCIDAMVELIHSSEGYEDGVQERKFLINLCKQNALIPTSSIITRADVQWDMNTSAIETGASARVFTGTYKDTKVAIKCFRLYSSTLQRGKQLFCREAMIVKFLRHPNVLPFLGVIFEDAQLCILSPWLKNGDIKQYLHTNPNVSAKELVEQVADGLDFLKQKRIVHGDIKGSNVLITDDGNACISDFGLSFIETAQVQEIVLPSVDPSCVSELRNKCRRSLRLGGFPESLDSSLASKISSVSASGAGTDRWMAPERLLPEAFQLPSAKATFASDVYSFGCLVAEAYSLLLPFQR